MRAIKKKLFTTGYMSNKYYFLDYLLHLRKLGHGPSPLRTKCIHPDARITPLVMMVDHGWAEFLTVAGRHVFQRIKPADLLTRFASMTLNKQRVIACLSRVLPAQIAI